MGNWTVMMRKADFKGLSEKFGIRDITARLLVNRGLNSEDEIERFLKGDASMLRDSFELADVEKGASIMLGEINRGSRIRVIGDYDVDGICSSYILVMGLGLLGADVDFVLPDRVKDGYGLSVKLVDEAFADERTTIITCDNGIAAYEQIAHAKEMGMTVVVTDHHEVPYEDTGEILPPADAVIDPKRKEGNCSFKEICGAVVAYKFLQVMAKLSGRDGEQEVKDFFDEMLIFAGIATVCDVMELRDENRIIVRESLRRIPYTKNVGLKALISVTELEPERMSAFHYGFVIGPCLNASGRLDLASRALSLFLEQDFAVAAKMAADLKAMNESRKMLTKKGVDEASNIIEKRKEESGLPKVLVVYLKDDNETGVGAMESIVGIVAGRIREKYSRPSIVLTDAADGGIKGSGRSMECYDMFAALSEVKDLFTRFGGHKMAAGLSLPLENLQELDRRLNENCSLGEKDFEPLVKLDMELPFLYADMELVREFEILEPFGNGNNKPLFGRRGVRLLSGRILGKNKNCGKYTVTDDGIHNYDMMYFGDMDRWHRFLDEKFGKGASDGLYRGEGFSDMTITVAYYPDINSYMGREKIQIIMSDYC